MDALLFFFFFSLLSDANEISLSLYINRFFHILQISYEIKKKVYSHVYLTIRVIELACYGSRNKCTRADYLNMEQRKFRLNLRYMILTSAALNLLVILYCFSFVFVRLISLSSLAVFVTFVLKLAVS